MGKTNNNSKVSTGKAPCKTTGEEEQAAPARPARQRGDAAARPLVRAA